MMNALLRRVKLNLNVLGLALTNRWLHGDDFARSYDRIAPHYERTWLTHLRGITDTLLSAVPDRRYGHILDLGCGTGYTTARLASRFPASRITAVDISEGMLGECRKRVDEPNVRCVREDMLAHAKNQESASTDLIVSAWAIGYSEPWRVVDHVSRLLRRGGVFAFVVNYLDTLKPVFDTLRFCMRRYPDRVAKVTLPRFPRNRKTVLRRLSRRRIGVLRDQEGCCLVREHADKGERLLSWLLRTGVLAGFDQMMPLGTDPELGAAFENHLIGNWRPLTHHYVMVVGEKVC
jgi:SAM-dependent methyltransferase